ncbi:T9SS type B sorting domain-containing protein [Flavobacterium seoulense]|uniref:T9SS type B sorting domain-containing protein n=1 Tax=Flavobacterium seoulense TaxID=1492738 RepID=UPI0013644935|nr:T9SS type B sorting domain-containing protein [Flavobacterium seoulense]
MDNHSLQVSGESGVYIGTDLGRIHLVTDLMTNPTLKNVCINLGFALVDIAYNQNGDMYVCNAKNIYKINKTDCTIENVHSFNTISGINSLSFDRQSNIYLGGSSSVVYRLNNGNYNQLNVWNDFGTGRPAGDFVMFGDKMYIAWSLNGNCLLYQVTVDNNMNYVSHRVLGNLPINTFGLASELGSLYGVASTELFRININSNSISNETILMNNGLAGAWWGAAGINEAVAFDVKVYETVVDAQNQVNALPSGWKNTIAGGQTVYVVIKNSVNQQSEIVPVDIKIRIAPSFTTPENIVHCESDTNASLFNINGTVSEIIGSQTNVDVSFHESEVDAMNDRNPLPDLYSISGKYKKVYFRVTNSIAGCFSVSSFDLIINDSPIFTIPNDITICDVFPFDLNLKALESKIVGNQSNVQVTFYESDIDALNNSNPLPNIYIVNSSSNPIYFRVTDVLTGCFSMSKFGFKTNLRPAFSKPKDIIVCQTQNSDNYLDDLDNKIQEILNGQNSTNFIVSFYKSHDDASNKINEITFPYNINENDDEIFFRIENSLTSCFNISSFFIYLRAESQNANIPFSVKTSDWKSERNEIEIIASGNYEYSMDGLTYQDDPVFKDLLPGEYQIFIRDKESCSVISEDVFLMMYRNFFTPNGDGINDYWNIIGSSSSSNIKIMIYDRYGKLIKNLNGNSLGWDGTFNNNPMPSSDYWFELITEQGKKLKGHFSLKR